MTGVALTTRLRPAVGAVGRIVGVFTSHVVVALSVVVGVQISLTAILFFSVEHNGWLTYQGGDQIWLVTSGWLLGQGTLPYALVGPAWPVLLMPLTWITGASSVQLLPLTTLLQVCVLGPIATLAVYDIAARLAGRVAGIWCASAWVLAPYLAIPLFVDRYQERWTDQVLVQALGLTQLADYPSMVVALVSAALVVRSLDERSLREAVLAGSLAGLAIGLKPSNVLFLVGVAAAYLLARRFRAALAFALALLPALVTLTIWKQRGTGSIPLLALDEVHTAASTFASSTLPLANSFFERFPLDLDDWKRNMSNLREFFWSARLAQWVPLAGALAVARRSLPGAGMLLGWALAYIVVKGSSNVAGIENASFWRLVMPALPAYVMLAAAIPLLVPTLPVRLGARIAAAAPTRRPGRRLVIVLVAALAVVPTAVVLAATPSTGSGKAIEVNGILVPVDGATVTLTVQRQGAAARLTWTDATARADTFYRVFRTQGPGADAQCSGAGSERCQLEMITLATTRDRAYVDSSPEPGVTYRIGVAANWLDDPEQGDVFALSPPVVAG